MTPVAPIPTVDDLLAQCRRLVDAGRVKLAIRGLTALLGRGDALTRDQRSQVLRQRVQALLMLGLDRRAWLDVQSLPSSPANRLLEAELWERNASPVQARAAIRALARANPTEVALWRRVEALTPADFNAVGHHYEVAMGLARAPDVDPAHLLRTADMLVRAGAGADAERMLDRIPAPGAEQFQRIVRLRARVRMENRDSMGLARLLDDIDVGGLDDLLEVYRFALAAGRVDTALEWLQDGKPAVMDLRWLRAMVMLWCQTGRLEAAGNLVRTYGTPGDDAYVVWWGAKGDRAAIRNASTTVQARDWPVRLIHEAEAWLEHPRTRDRALETVHEALRQSTETNPAIFLNKFRVRGILEHRDEIGVGFGPLLPPEFHQLSHRRARRWLKANAATLLERLNGGRDELLVYRDEAGEVRVFHVPIDQRLQLVNLRRGLLDLGFERTLEAYSHWRARFGAPPLWYTHRAEVRLWSGDVDGARADLEAALALDADTRWAYVGLGLVHVAQERYEAALEVWKQGEARLGPLTSGWPVAAEALLRLGRLKKGRMLLHRAIEHRPQRLSIRIIEALYAWAEGRSAADLVASISRTYPRIWAVAAGEDDRTRLESMLTLMGANRSSSLIVWRHPLDGWCLTQARPLS